MKKLIQKDPEGPDVDSVIVLSSKKHFGSHVLVGTAESTPSTADIAGCPAEIAYLYICLAI